MTAHPEWFEFEYPAIVPPLRVVEEVKVERRRIGTLRLHPSWSSCGLATLTVPGCLKSGAHGDPIYVSTSGIVLRGFDRFEELQSRENEELSCVVYPLNDIEALQWIIKQTVRQDGLSPYARILLTRDLLDASLKLQAKENMRSGGANKGLSNVTNLKQVHRRKEIARVARVAEGYVSYAARINKEATNEVKLALLTNELPIFRALEFIKSKRDQNKCLADFRAGPFITKDVRRAMRKLLRQKSGQKFRPDEVFADITKNLAKVHEPIQIGTIRTAGNVVLFSEHFLDQFFPNRTGDLFNG